MTRVAVVTGATSGIGRSIAVSFTKDCLQVLATGRRKEALGNLSSAFPGIATRSADLCTPGIMTKLLEAANEKFGSPPSVVVLSAGRGLKGGLLSSDPSQWEELIRINQLSMMLQMRECAEFLLACSEVSLPTDIVIIGSTVGRQVSTANPVYGATKFALHSLCESLRQELCGSGIRVSLLEPGFVKTGFQDTAGYDRQWFASLEEEFGPFLQPDDVAAVVSFIICQPPHVHLDDIRIRPTRQKI